MKVLVIGGTRFVGKHLVRELLSRSHQVTLFHRGSTNVGLFEGEVERVFGDRDTDFEKLAGRSFDSIVDCCAYKPGQVRKLAMLQGLTQYYLFVSTISVYDPQGKPIVEGSQLHPALWDEELAVDGETYGAFKVACEEELAKHESSFKHGFGIVRPGLIVGPDDPTGRFPYWIQKIASGGDVLVPDDAEAKCQFLDVRDLASFLVDCCESTRHGTYNAVGPADEIRFFDLLEAIKESTSASGSLIKIPIDVLQKSEVQPWTQIPLYSGYSAEDRWIDNVSKEAATRLGLRNRDPKQTVDDTYRWLVETGTLGEFKVGMSEALEQRLLAEFSSHVADSEVF